MTTTQALAREQFVLLTTFRKDGTPVPTTVWVVGLDGGGLGVITPSETGKVRRIRRDGAVTLVPCTRRGVPLVPGGTPVRGTARVLDAAGTAEVGRAVRRKYGVLALLIEAVARIGRRPRVGLGIALD